MVAEIEKPLKTPEELVAETRFREVVFEQQTMWIRRLVWLYIILWLVEGGLRRWFLPGLATPLLLIRDPVVVAIYVLAFTKGLFPTNGFILSGVVLAVVTVGSAIAVGHGNWFVAAYGARCDFLHVPLIFIMARVLRQKDVLNLAKVAVWLVIPYTVLLVMQFYSPQSAWVNRGVGDSLEGAGFSGALDRFRPPGTFSFITGPAQLYPLFAACWFTLVLARRMPVWLMIASGMAILVAVPVSISRLLLFGVLIVVIVGIVVFVMVGRSSFKIFLKMALGSIILILLTIQLPAFKDGIEAFQSRWDATIEAGDGVQGAILDRIWDSFTAPFKDVTFLGLGTGFSTNVGQKLLTDQASFGASEGEWGRLLYDNGFILGFLLVAYRVALVGAVVWMASRAWGRRSPYSLLFVAATFPLLLIGQWGQATSLGAAIIGGGLILASAKMEDAITNALPQRRQSRRKEKKA